MPRTVIKSLLPFLFLVLMSSLASGDSLTLPFNKLVIEKADLEKRYGIKTLECFSFLEKIGDDNDQAVKVEHCLQGLRKLAHALEQVPDARLRVVGISTRFLRTGGFHTLLIPWDAGEAELARALKDKMSPEDQGRFLDKVLKLKKGILNRLSMGQLYCTQRISNDQCVQGYETLRSVAGANGLGKKKWAQVAVTDSYLSRKDPFVLSIRYDATPSKMAEVLRNKDVYREWDSRKKIYEEIKEKYQKAFKSRLKLANLFCSVDLTREECLQGASNLYEASGDEGLQGRKWGKVQINRHNTSIQNDFDILLRYDLSAGAIIKYFLKKPVKKQVEKNVTRAERLEKIAKNNSTALRAVCDLQDLRSAICVKGFETFIQFVRKHPAYKAARPWTELMFVDGSQLTRVNFALNSAVRQNYLYIDANSGFEELETFLLRFGLDREAETQ